MKKVDLVSIPKTAINTSIGYKIFWEKIHEHPAYEELLKYHTQPIRDINCQYAYNNLDDWLDCDVKANDFQYCSTGLAVLLAAYADVLDGCSTLEEQVDFIIGVLAFFITWTQVIQNIDKFSSKHALSVIKPECNISIFNKKFPTIRLKFYTRSEKYDLWVLFKLSTLNAVSGETLFALVRRDAIAASDLLSPDCIKAYKKINMSSYSDLTPSVIEDIYAKYLDSAI